MTLPVYAAMTGAIILILQQILMMRVGFHRINSGVNIGLGAGEDLHLERKVRRHGNLAENAAIFIVILALAELVGAPQAAVIGFGTLFIVARLSHAFAFTSLAGSHGQEGGKPFAILRIVGAFGNLIATVGLSIYLLFLLIA